MRNTFFLSCLVLSLWGCGGSESSCGSNDAGDAGPQDAPPAEPDVSPDVGIPCYECDTNGLCMANQAAEPGCAFGDFREGDLCEPGVTPCTCVIFGSNTIGVCTQPCASPADCTAFGAECVDFGSGNVFCYWTCTTASDCPGS